MSPRRTDDWRREAGRVRGVARLRIACGAGMLSTMVFMQALAHPDPAADANGAVATVAAPERWYGLYPASNFSISSAGDAESPASRHAAWYFRAETVAVPRAGLPLAGFETGVRAFDDLRHWAAARAPDAPLDYPPLVWVAASQVIQDARLGRGASEIDTPTGGMPIRLAPRIALNHSYVDASSLAYFAPLTLTLRGSPTPEGFIVRSLWPEAFRVGPLAPQRRSLPALEATEAMRALMREAPRGGAQSPYAATTLWQRAGDSGSWAGKPVLALMVNGAQGDDDEAHGGHFAIVTGRIQPDGAIGDWLVNNFYSLDVESEKGIIAAPVPLDNYLADLNSGQGWYRPTTMLVAVLNDERAAALVQSGLNRVFNQFYRHQLVYYHPNQNCASISVDTLRALGWDVPARGPSSRVLAWLAYPYFAIKEWSIGKAKLAFDYLRTDQTRLMPAAALEEAFADLLALVKGKASPAEGRLARMLAQDTQALAFVRFPQFPSSRAFGDAPAVSTWEYRTRVPNDPALAQIVPVPPRPFPDELRDPDLLPPRWTPADVATLVWCTLSVIGLPILLWRWWRGRRARARPAPGVGR